MLWVLSCDESTYLLNVNVNVFNLMCDGSVALNVNTMCVTCVDIHAQWPTVGPVAVEGIEPATSVSSDSL